MKERASLKPASQQEEEQPAQAKLEPDYRPIFQQLSEVFNNMEVLSLMKGEISKVKDI